VHLRDLFQIQTLDESLVDCGFDFLLYFQGYGSRRSYDGRNHPCMPSDSGISHVDILDRSTLKVALLP
jgi:hypothetical protein